MLQFITPIILASTFIDENGWTCDPEKSVSIVNTTTGIQIQEKRLYGYYTSEQKIYLCPQVLEDKKLYTLVYLHEYAHHIFFTKLSQEQQNKWADMADTSDTESYVSEYAKRHCEEDFAEVFAYVLLKNKMNTENTLLRKKVEFIKIILSSSKK